MDLGYRVVVPDKLGYGGTDKPESESEYTPRKITGDIAALMDLLQIPRAVSRVHIQHLFLKQRSH